MIAIVFLNESTSDPGGYISYTIHWVDPQGNPPPGGFSIPVNVGDSAQDISKLVVDETVAAAQQAGYNVSDRDVYFMPLERR